MGPLAPTEAENAPSVLVELAAMMAAEMARAFGPVINCKRCSHRHRRREPCAGLTIYRGPGPALGREGERHP